MNGPTHQLIGVTIAGTGTLAAGFPPETAALVASSAYATSKLPDLDQRIWGLRHRCALTHGILIAAPIVLILAATAALASPIPILTAVIIGAATGILAHIAADACTVSGITAWPLRDRTGRPRHIWLLPRPLRHNMTPRRARARRPPPRRVPPRAPR
jgi:membrane-bound metal-dependent hydrolase YbcI (DUF457 family)